MHNLLLLIISIALSVIGLPVSAASTAPEYSANLAASAPTPLYLLLRATPTNTDAAANTYPVGDLWKVWLVGEHTPIQITHWGYNFMPVISPNGRYIAYQSLPQQTIDYINSEASHAEGVVFEALPFNLWLMNTQTENAVRIAEQDPSIHIDYAQYDIVNGVNRSIPAWSPDSKKIAWIEAESVAATRGSEDEHFSPQLVIYDVDTGVKKVVATHIPFNHYLSPQAGGMSIGAIKPLWGSAGIVIRYRSDDGPFRSELFDPSGKLQGEFQVTVKENYETFPGQVWLTDQDKQYLGIFQGTSSGWLVVDVKTGESVDRGGLIEGNTVNRGLALAFTGSQWQLLPDDRMPQYFDNCTEFQYSPAPLIAISPDGKQAACGETNTHTLYFLNANGVIAQTSFPDYDVLGMSWGVWNWHWR